MAEHPLRADSLEIDPVDDGFMIYQPERDRVHYLNHTAVLVLEFCNGENSPAQLAALVQKAFGLDGPPDREVLEILAKLKDEALIR